MRLKVVTICMLLFGVVGFSANHLRRSTAPQKQENLAQSQTPDLPTPIQEGVMTRTQRQHSKLFGGYRHDVTRGKTLHDLILERGDIEVGRGVGNVILPSSFSMGEYFAKLSCQSDLVIIGTITNKSTNLIEDGSFTFTEYTLVASEVLKDNPSAPIQTNSEVTVVRASGSVKLLNHVARAIDYSQRPLAIGGRYLLFLRFIPDTYAYRSFGDSATDDSFKLDGNEVVQVSAQPFPLGSNRAVNSTSFQASVRAASRASCVR